MSSEKIRLIAPTAIISMVITLLIVFFALQNEWVQRSINLHSSPHLSEKDSSEKTLFTCGMHPWIISEEAGNCPICGMKLTPKRDNDSLEKESSSIDGVNVSIDPVVRQNMGIRLGSVQKAPAIHTIRTYGHITFDETRVSRVSPKTSGWYEKLYVDFTGQAVKKGDPLLEIYSPELLTAQEEYLSAYRNSKRLKGRDDNDFLKSARRRLLYFGVAKKEINAIERSGKVNKTIIIRSPFTGVVTQKNVVQGDYVKAGMTIYTIVDLTTVWVEAHIYEYEVDQVHVGQQAEMKLPYHPGKIFTGKITYIYPYLQQKTRDVVVRIVFSNPKLVLKPDMYADVYIKTHLEQEGLMIPLESVIRSGERNLVFVKISQGTFSPRAVTMGKTLDNHMVQIYNGLKAGEQVVISGQFLLDSESKLKEAVQKMMNNNLESKTSLNADEQVESGDDFFDDM
ncbi:hemolysin D [Candidatus Magnetomorum sp. HK-1]|nr:hemolysin D [Candidatus Magnetomorum sp. HK-1]